MASWSNASVLTDGMKSRGGSHAVRAAETAPIPPALPLRFSDPLRVLLCWAALLYRAGTLDTRLLSRAGISAEDLSAFADEQAEALAELRRLHLAGALFGRRGLAALLRARLAEGLMGATRAGELLALTRALAAAPDWAWEEDEEEAGRAGQGPGAGPEALARRARAEMARLASEQSAVALPSSAEGGSAATEQQLERIGALLDRFDAAALSGEAPRRVRNAAYNCGPGRQPSPTKAKRKPRR